MRSLMFVVAALAAVVMSMPDTAEAGRPGRVNVVVGGRQQVVVQNRGFAGFNRSRVVVQQPRAAVVVNPGFNRNAVIVNNGFARQQVFVPQRQFIAVPQSFGFQSFNQFGGFGQRAVVIGGGGCSGF